MGKVTLCLGLRVAPWWNITNTGTLGYKSLQGFHKAHVKRLIIQELKNTRYGGNAASRYPVIHCQAVLSVFKVAESRLQRAQRLKGP